MEDFITWLHVSDWHHGHKGKGDRNVVRRALLDDIHTQLSQHFGGRVDFLIFSGDLAFSGQEGEYRLAVMDFLEPLRKEAGVEKDRVILVPGNHDLDRNRLKLLAPFSALFKERNAVADAFDDSDQRRILLFPMQAYSQFVTTYLEKWAPPEPSYCFQRSYPIRDHKIAIWGFNSAWTCGQVKDPATGEIDDYGRLILGEHQVQGLLDFKQRENPEIVIAVMHHPFWWLSEVENRSSLEDDLLRNCHFILRGHEHRFSVSVPTGTAGNCAIISAGAAYDRREYPNGYNITKLDLRQGSGHVFVRRYDSDRNRFSRDSAATDDAEMVTFTLPKELSKPVNSTPSSVPIGDPWRTQSPATMEALTAIYEKQHQVVKLPYLKAAVIVEAKSLLATSPSPDRVILRTTFKAGMRSVYCHRISVMWGKDSEYQANLAVSVTGPDGNVGFISIPTSRHGSNSRDLLLFFVPTLPPQSGPFTLEKQESIMYSMKPLRDQGADELYMELNRASERVPIVDFVLRVPVPFGELEFTPGSRPGAFGNGELLPDETGLAEYGRSEGFRTYCWRSRDVPPDSVVAVDIRRKQPVVL